MPCTVKVRVIEARNLPVMDRSSDLTDAYVELRFLDSVKKTEIRRKTLNPIWNEDFRFEVPQDSQLQDHPIKLKVYDHDVVSADDVIGTIHVDLNCLLNKSGGQIAGWFPIFDTLRGIRGDLNIVVKVELFGDVNEFREASTGVQFIASSKPELFHEIVESQGLVAYIVVKSDPEYHWMDNFRASRISNEERQLLLYNLSGKLRRHIGKKAIEMGGNTVLGYNQYFDLEGENGIVARGYGTCCTTKDIREGGINMEDASPLVPKKAASLNIPHSGSLENMSTILSTPEIKDNMMNSSNFPVKLLTLNNFEIEDVERFGGIVIARSVKYLSHAKSSSAKGGKKLRNEWWQEIREEIRTHARFFGCDTVIGYHEMFTMDCDKEICVLTAVGTAAMMSSKYSGPIFNDQTSTATREEKIKRKAQECSNHFCHIPHKHRKPPYNMKLTLCNICKKKYVPQVLITSIEPPNGISVTGKGCLLEARICREKKKFQGEMNAIAVSEGLPFMEYNLHRQLMYKLRIMGMNAAFRLKMQIAIGESLIVAIATATAFFIPALPSPRTLQINRSLDVVDEEDKQLLAIQNRIVYLSRQNQLQLANASTVQYSQQSQSTTLSTTPGNETIQPALTPEDQTIVPEDEELKSSSEGDPNRSFIVEVDDSMDEDIMAVLLEPPIPHGFSFCNTETLPGGNPVKSNGQMITAIRRVEWQTSTKRMNQQFSSIFHNLYSTILFKVRALAPCCLCSLTVDIHLPRDDQLEITLNAMVVLESEETAAEEERNASVASTPASSSGLFSEEELQFSMEMVQQKKSLNLHRMAGLIELLEQDSRSNPRGVELTPMTFIPGTHLLKYIGRINMHLIKESFTVKEQGGLGNFTHVFVNEVHAVVRSHVAALGGNALLSYRVDESTIVENASKNQCYCLLSISGDVALVFSDRSHEHISDQLEEISLNESIQ